MRGYCSDIYKNDQVLEEVCTRQSFFPADDYDLVHGRKVLDLTLAFRFSNLPNNTKLELVKASSSRTQDKQQVTIALQLPDGQRLQHVFDPTTTLWQILEHWEESNESCKGQLTNVDSSQTPPAIPVCIYMRDEVIGEEALRDMTLKMLALTSGKAIIRFVHRAVDDETLSAVLSKLEESRAKQARLSAHSASSATSSQASTVSSAAESVSRLTDSVAMEAEAADTSKAKPQRTHRTREEPMETQEGGEEVAESSTSSARLDMTADRCGENSENALVRRLNTQPGSAGGPSRGQAAPDSSAIQQLRDLNLPGVQVFTPEDFDDLTPEDQETARRLAQQFLAGIVSARRQDASRPQSRAIAPKPPAFADFKFPEATRGKDLYRNELSDVKRQEFAPCEREEVIFDSNEGSSKTTAEDVPDEFFEVTDSDVRSMYSDLQKQVSSDRPLMTEAMRLAEIEKRHSQYEYVMIRVQFPDGLVLQACFRPRETVYALYKFVKEHLTDSDQNFYLYKTPPRQVLSEMDNTLVEADLAPATLVFFSSESREEHYLSDSARQGICPKRRAEELAVKKQMKKRVDRFKAGSSMGDLDQPELPRLSDEGSSGYRTPHRTHPSGNRPGSSDPKVPKWLKLSKQ